MINDKRRAGRKHLALLTALVFVLPFSGSIAQDASDNGRDKTYPLTGYYKGGFTDPDGVKEPIILNLSKDGLLQVISQLEPGVFPFEERSSQGTGLWRRIGDDKIEFTYEEFRYGEFVCTGIHQTNPPLKYFLKKDPGTAVPGTVTLDDKGKIMKDEDGNLVPNPDSASNLAFNCTLFVYGQATLETDENGKQSLVGTMRLRAKNASKNASDATFPAPVPYPDIDFIGDALLLKADKLKLDDTKNVVCSGVSERYPDQECPGEYVPR